MAKLVRAVAAAVVGEQGAHHDAVTREELEGLVEEGDGGGGLLVGQHLGEGEAGVIVDSDVQGLKAGMLMLAATPAIGAQKDLLITGQALDIEVQQIAGMRVLIANHGRCGMKIAPAAEAGALENAADRGRAESGAASDLIAWGVLAAELDDLVDQRLGQSRGAAKGRERSARRAALTAVAPTHLAAVLGLT